ncbi:MAG: efflux RND transporter periplasmic adaptor subunit [Elusimicrobiota bacterium]
MKKILGSSILLIILLAGGYYWFEQKNKNKKNGTTIQKLQVVEGSLEKAVEATGEVSPLNRVEIKPPVSGRIEKILVDEGNTVKAGQVLAWLSSSDRVAILDAARAQGEDVVKKWEDTYKPTPIVAPLSGVIILKNIVVGQTVENGTILFAMSDKLIVLTYVDEVDIGRVKVGMRAHIKLDAYPNDSVEGRVSSILYEGKNVSNVITYGVKVEPLSKQDFFRSQMTANVRLVIESRNKALIIPSDAVINLPEGRKGVLVPGTGERSEEKPIETGLEAGDNVEIVSGLNLGDTIVIVKKLYVPQKGQSSSPLTMRRPSNSSSQGASQRRREN